MMFPIGSKIYRRKEKKASQGQFGQRNGNLKTSQETFKKHLSTKTKTFNKTANTKKEVLCFS